MEEVLSTDELLGVVLASLLRQDGLRGCQRARLVCKRWQRELARAKAPHDWKAFCHNCTFLRGQVEQSVSRPTGPTDAGARWMMAMWHNGINGMLDSRVPSALSSCAAFVAHHKAMGMDGSIVVLAPPTALEGWLAAFAHAGVPAFANVGRLDQRLAAFLQLVERLGSASAGHVEVVISTYSMAAADIESICPLKPKFVFFDAGMSQTKQYASRLAPLLLHSEHHPMGEAPSGFLIDDASLLQQRHTKTMQLVRFSLDHFIKLQALHAESGRERQAPPSSESEAEPGEEPGEAAPVSRVSRRPHMFSSDGQAMRFDAGALRLLLQGGRVPSIAQLLGWAVYKGA